MASEALPELATVPWRQPTDARWLRRWGRIWHAWTLLYTIPFIAAAVGMFMLDPLATPVALAALAHAWIIPELYAFRGASVVRPKARDAAPGEPVAQGLLIGEHRFEFVRVGQALPSASSWCRPAAQAPATGCATRIACDTPYRSTACHGTPSDASADRL